MNIYTLRCELLAEQPIADTFQFFENPHNLAKITPSWLSFQVTSPEQVKMRKGAEIDYTIRWLSLPMRWRTAIQAYDPPLRFVDEQAQGPYALWQHHHTFRQTAAGTIVTDRVDYALPFGLVGRFVHWLLIRWQLLAIFRYRQRALAQLLGCPTRQILQPFISANQAPAWQPRTIP